MFQQYCHDIPPVDIPYVTELTVDVPISDYTEFSWDQVVPDAIPSDHYFTMGEVIGIGTTSTVVEASHPLHGKVAVKIISPEWSSAALYELAILKTVQGHIHFPRVFDAWCHRGTWYIAMTRMDGTLVDRMECGMTNDERVDALKQIVEAMVFLHDIKKIVHFDLTPQNMGYIQRLDGTVTYVLLDFGQSDWIFHVLKPEYQLDISYGNIVNTCHWYRSCEAFGLNGQPITEKVDVWSLGCILYEMIMGIPLLETLQEQDTITVIQTIMNTAIEHVHQLYVLESYQLTHIMKACLSTMVSDRISMRGIQELLRYEMV